MNKIRDVAFEYITRKPKQPKTFAGKLSYLSYLPENERAVEGSKLGLDLDRDLSDKTHTVFKDRSSDKVYVTFRGTSDLQDVVPDLNIALGRQNKDKRFQTAVDRTKQVQEKYKGKSIELHGHSLGGALAIHASSKTGLPGKALNPGLNILQRNIKHNIVIERQKGDLVSQIFDKSGENPLIAHGVENF
jgi:hypothetical protein